jgi:hypothetical protein
MSDQIPGLEDAKKAFQKYSSARAKRLANLERYVAGTQYEGLPDWFSDTKPLWERAPCIVYPIVKAAIDSNSDLLLGDGRFPAARVDGLSGDEAEKFEKATSKVSQQARLKAASREVFAAGQGCGTACAVFGLRSGRLFIDTLLARWCEPTLAPDGSVLSIEVKYPYLAIERIEGTETWVCKLYRRTIDATADTTYKPVTVRADAQEPTFTIDEEVKHGFGFCPVLWFPHLKGCAAINDFDGRAIHEHLTDEIRAHDFALSQRHRAALYAGDPQWTEIGVEQGYNPTASARKAEVPGAWVSEGPNPSSKARKKSPGTVWQYTGKNPEVKVELHTLPGDALTALDNHAKDLRSKLSESLGVVFLDLEALPNESRLSGRALESAKARQLDRVNYYRSDFGDKFILPALGMLLRIAIKTGLKIEGLDQVKTLAKDETWSWHAPPIDLVWGEYFKPNGEEEFMIMQAVEKAKTAGIATDRILVERVKNLLGIRDVDSYMLELKKHQDEAKEREKEMIKAEADARPKPAAPAGAKR